MTVLRTPEQRIKELEAELDRATTEAFRTNKKAAKQFATRLTNIKVRERETASVLPMNTYRNAKINATCVILDEHRNLATVVQDIEYFVRMVDEGKAAPDLTMFRAMLLYVTDYPERLHHPKEDRYLFARLHEHETGLDCALAELEFQHAKGSGLVHGMSDALNRFEVEGKSAFPSFRDRVFQYAAFSYAHRRLEEDVVLPAAAKILTDDDWHAVNLAFAANDNSLIGVSVKRDLEELFTKIVNFTLSIGMEPAPDKTASAYSASAG